MSSAVQAMAKRESCTVGWTRGLRSGRWVAMIVVAILVAAASGCTDKSKLSRGKAEKLIAEALMKKPPVAEVELRMEVPNITNLRSKGNPRHFGRRRVPSSCGSARMWRLC
jgi:hypothetical protein